MSTPNEKPNKYRLIIGRQVAKIRVARGETQTKMAKEFSKRAPKELKASKETICKYEKGTISMPAEKYLKFLAMNPPGNPL